MLWILDNNFVTEKGRKVEFSNHRWAIDYLADQHRHKVAPKAAQAGMTFLEFLDDIHLTGLQGMDVAHTFHVDAVLQKIVRPKLNPLIMNNPAIKRMMTVDSEGLKGFNGSFLHIIGANSESNAISFSADILKIDEKDRSNPAVVEMLESRLKASNIRFIREFSNPSAKGKGVDVSWRKSDQRHWMVTCTHCNYESYVSFELEDALGIQSHYIDHQLRQYVCGNDRCHREITDADRINGRWVAAYANRDEIHGYWISQLMLPWISAADIIADYDTKSAEYFNNFVLGRAYTPSDFAVDRQTILQACAPSVIPRIGVALGVDQKASEQEWVAMTAQGVFAYGRTKSWEEIERLKLMWNATLAMDAQPYQAGPKMLVEKYSDAYMCYFMGEKRGLDVVEFKGNVVYIDRTRLLDLVAKEISDARILFRMRPMELEEYIGEWQNIYRTTEEKPDGRIVSTWVKVEGKESDYPFAHSLARVALSRLMQDSGGFTLVEPGQESSVEMTDGTRGETGRAYTTVHEAVKQTFDMMDC